MAQHNGSSIFFRGVNTWSLVRCLPRPDHPDGDLYYLVRRIWGETVTEAVSEAVLDEENRDNRNWNYFRDGQRCGGHDY